MVMEGTGMRHTIIRNCGLALSLALLVALPAAGEPGIQKQFPNLYLDSG